MAPRMLGRKALQRRGSAPTITMSRKPSGALMRLATSVLVATALIAVPELVDAQSAIRNPQSPYSISQIKSYPFPTQLTAAATGSRIAWVLNEQGRRNIWVAEGPAFAPRRLTSYTADDGQDLTSVSLSADGKFVVYIRGGDFGSNFDDAEPVNPAGMPAVPEVQMWSVPFGGGAPVALGEGENPVIAPKGDV